ncbi:MAG: hypothetical protein QM762_12535 [Chryseolinea sp.]
MMWRILIYLIVLIPIPAIAYCFGAPIGEIMIFVAPLAIVLIGYEIVLHFQIKKRLKHEQRNK